MRHRRVLFASWVVLSGPLLLAAPIREDKATDSPAVVSQSAGPTIKDKATDQPKSKDSSITSSDIGEIEKMVAAGVSKDVIMAYIENAHVARSLTPAEIISLKEHAVPDEITAALLKRFAQIKAQSIQASTNALANPAYQTQPGNAYLDPEGYDFWWSHYAYPRALSYAYRTQYPYPFPTEYYGLTGGAPSFSYFPIREPRVGSFGSRHLFAPPIRSQTAAPLGIRGRSGDHVR